MTENGCSLLLADANTGSRIGLRHLLTSAGFHVAAETGYLDELDSLLQMHRPHLLLLASNLPPPDAPVLFLADLRRFYPETAVVLLLDHHHNWPLRELTDTGVSGLIAKTESGSAIVQMVRTAASGSVAISPELLDGMMALPDTPTVDAPLTITEQQLLQLLCADKSNPEIAQALNLGRKTVEKRLTALYRKLGVRTRTGAVAWRLEDNKEGTPI